MKRKVNKYEGRECDKYDREGEILIRSNRRRRCHAGALFINGSFNFCGLFYQSRTDLIKNFYFFYDPAVNKTILLFAVINFQHLKIGRNFCGMHARLSLILVSKEENALFKRNIFLFGWDSSMKLYKKLPITELYFLINNNFILFM